MGKLYQNGQGRCEGGVFKIQVAGASLNKEYGMGLAIYVPEHLHAALNAIPRDLPSLVAGGALYFPVGVRTSVASPDQIVIKIPATFTELSAEVTAFLAEHKAIENGNLYLRIKAPGEIVAWLNAKALSSTN